MEKTRLNHDKPITIGANRTSVEISSCHDDNKCVVPESHEVSDNLTKNISKGSTEVIPVMEKTESSNGPVMHLDASQLKLAPMNLGRRSCYPEYVKGNTAESDSDGESSFTSSSADFVDDKIASFLSSCTLEDNPILEEKEDKTHECTAILPGRSLTVSPRKKLLVLHMNGFLADVVHAHETYYGVQRILRGKRIFKRPFCDDFLKFCFEKFNVGVWSSRKKYNVDSLADFLLGEFKHKLLFSWDQSKCFDTEVTTLDNHDSPLFLKVLKKLWNVEVTGLPWTKGEFSPSNTLLLDDSPHKALLNPPHTAIFPYPYHYGNRRDNSLGPRGNIRVYLEQLAMADDVQDYVKKHPFGQPAITESHRDWNFYSRIIKRYSYLLPSNGEFMHSFSTEPT